MIKSRKKIPFRTAAGMLVGYARARIMEQIKLVAFIILYLVLFQVFILQVPLIDSIGIAGGIALVIFGLAFFLDGLLLGLMPLGERVGVKLPTRVGIVFIAIFGLFLGFGATLAEPAISALRTAGAGVTAWDAPLLYMLLERKTEWLVTSVGIGVGIAVAVGMFRFYYELSIKPFIYVLIPLALVLSVIANFNPNLESIVGLAWDSGAVTTGAVTVPLVLALGIGVSRAASKNKASSGGFGIILLASAFPIISVLIIGFVFNGIAPKATSEKDFFSISNRQQAYKLFNDDYDLLKHAYMRGTETGRRSFYGNDTLYWQSLQKVFENQAFQDSLLGDLTTDEWLSRKASDTERRFVAGLLSKIVSRDKSIPVSDVLAEESVISVRAVIPLTIMLLLVLLLLLKEKLRYKDEFALGIFFAMIGMALLTSGIRLGLGPLGGQVGSQLPRAFSKQEKYIDSKMIPDFDTSLVFSAIDVNGEKKKFFRLKENGEILNIEFKPEKFNTDSGVYEYVITQPPLLGPNLSILGIALVLLFAFGMGYGATIAEPGLNALGITVEELTVGAIKRIQILQVVSVGVGLGLVFGVIRILYDIPLIWLVLPSYLLLIPLTIISEEEFTAIAWDCGGVTTGPVTVPLVLAMGLSIGSELYLVDGFGVLAMASSFPILTVLLYGLYSRARQKELISQKTNVEDE